MITCFDCGDELHNEPAPDGTETWVDTTGGDVCPSREDTGGPDLPHRPAREWTVTMTSMPVTAPDEQTAIERWEESTSGGNQWEAALVTEGDEQPDLAEMRLAVDALLAAREFESNDGEIDALTEALTLALGRWPDLDRSL